MAEPYATYTKGNVFRAGFQVKNLGAFISPTTVTCKTKIDGGSSVDQVVLQDGVGRYYADIDTTSMTAGDYSLSWQGTGAAVCKKEQRFTVKEALIP